MIRETHTKWLLFTIACLALPLPWFFAIAGGLSPIPVGAVIYVEIAKDIGPSAAAAGVIWVLLGLLLLRGFAHFTARGIHALPPAYQPILLLGVIVGFVVLSFQPVYATSGHTMHWFNLWDLYRDSF